MVSFLICVVFELTLERVGMGEKKRLDLKNAATSKSRSVDDGEGRPYPPADRGTKTEVTGGNRVCGRHTVCA